MRQAWPLLLALAAPLAAAQIYQSVGPDGGPVFTDRPVPNARELAIPARSDGDGTDDAATAGRTQSDAAGGFSGPYDMLDIVAPEDEHRTRNADGELPVSLVIAPALLDGHQVVVEVDGVPAEGELPNPTQVLLRGLALGTHRIRALIRNAEAVIVAATPTINVHVLPPLPESAKP